MAKRVIAVILLIALTLSLAGCRRRITDDSENVVSETYQVEVSSGDTTVSDETTPSDDSSDAEPQETTDPALAPSQETTPAEGGMEAPDATTPSKGKEITVTFDGQGGSCSPSSKKVNVNAVYGDLPLPTKSQYTFLGWYTQTEGGYKVDGNSVVTAQEDHILYARWSAKPSYTVTFDPNGGRISPYAKEKAVFMYEAYGELPVAYGDGYSFVGWFTKAEGGTQITSDTLFTAEKNQTLYAHWEYDPYSYWKFTRDNIHNSMYACQVQSLYVEYDAAEPVTGCSLITESFSVNLAEKYSGASIDDAWVKRKAPNAIVKIVSSGNYSQVLADTKARFPGFTVYVVPSSALYGTKEEQLWYQIKLDSLVYPDWFSSLDLEQIAEELGVSGQIYQ